MQTACRATPDVDEKWARIRFGEVPSWTGPGDRTTFLLNWSCSTNGYHSITYFVEHCQVKTKVYYADTDAGGVVYYANYLRWLEMARADWLEESGVSLAEYVRQGNVFAVVRVEIDYHVSAVLGDEVEVTVEPDQLRRVRFVLRQNVVRVDDGTKLASAKVTVACLTTEGKITSVPTRLAQQLTRST